MQKPLAAARWRHEPTPRPPVHTGLAWLCWLTLVSLPAVAVPQAVARVGSDSITVDQFARRYQSHLGQSVQPDAFAHRLSFARSLAEESALRQYARDTGLDTSPTVIRAGDRAWRTALLEELAETVYMDEVVMPHEEIQAEYRYRSTALLSRFLTLPDRHTAGDFRQRLAAGVPFESLALQAFRPSGLLDRPGQPGWRYPHELDSLYARRAYALAPGQVSAPFGSEQGFTVIQLLDRDFRPTHGHFDRVKHLQSIALDLLQSQLAPAAQQLLQKWADDQRVRWRRLAMRKALRSGLFNGPPATWANHPQAATLVGETLFILEGRPHTVEWLLSALELLPPDSGTGVFGIVDLRALINELLMWERMMVQVESLPGAEAFLSEAARIYQTASQQALWDTIQARILGVADVPDDSLRQLLAVDFERYASPPMVELSEIVVADSGLAADIADSLSHGGTGAFDSLARRYTLREWARPAGGKLGWVPLSLYGGAAPTLIQALEAPADTIVGPLWVDGYYVLAQPSGHRQPTLPPWPMLRPLLRQRWLEANGPRLLRERWAHLYAATYPIAIDTALVALLELSLDGRLVLPAPLALPLAADDSTAVIYEPELLALPADSLALRSLLTTDHQAADSTLGDQPAASP